MTNGQLPVSLRLELSEIKLQLSKIEKHLQMKDIFVKVYALTKIFDHLNEALNDPRKKERARANIALTTIKDWLIEGEDIYEQARNT